MQEFISKSEKETKDIAKKIASILTCGDIIVLVGDLGAGKTKFTEGFLSFWGLENEISSPTFTIVNQYLNENITINHFDVYRLEDIDEFYAIGGPEYFDNAISIIEWGELVEDILPNNYIKIIIDKSEEDYNTRRFILKTNNKELQNKIKEII